MAKLAYHGLKNNLPAERNAGSFYICTDTREIYFGANLYTEPVRYYTSAEKPANPAQGVLYVGTVSGAGDIWDGTAWRSVFKGYVTVIDDTADDNTVPTAKAAKDYIDQKVSDVVAGSIDGLGDLAAKDKVGEADLETALANKLNGKAAQADLNVLIGNDAGKSARTIANEELAAQLIPENAKESMDQLSEIAAWIQSHPDDASAMNAAIEKLQAILAGIGGTGEKATVVAYVTDAISALEAGDYASAAELTALASRVATLETKAHIHDNQAELDKIESGDKEKWDAAADAVIVGTF